MEWLSPYIIAGGLGYAIAQIIKYIVASVKGKRPASLRSFYASGNMPSSHSATVVAVMAVIGLRDGIGSGLFGLAFVFATVVLYDAMMVRRSSGEQGQSLVALIKEVKSGIVLPRVAIGHTPAEVVAGTILGTVIGLLVGVFIPW